MKNRESYIARVSIIYEPCVKRPIVSSLNVLLSFCFCNAHYMNKPFSFVLRKIDDFYFKQYKNGD
jgi:hypothetical protein